MDRLLKAVSRPLAAALAAVFLWSGVAQAAEARVYLLRGWFGVFSMGLDTMAEELAARGIRAQAIPHLSWQSTIASLASEWAAGNKSPIVLVGHSQGANNVIEMARALSANNIPVDLLVTLAPFLQDPVPVNVKHAMNFYQSPGWGAPLTADPGFKGRLSNMNLSGDFSVSHVSMDKSEKVQADILRAIEQVARGK
jgi:hypothetical protein